MDTIRTSAKFKHYDGLYGDIDHKPQAEYIFLEQIETRSKEFGWMVDPHIHSHLYQLFFIESGKVKFQSSSQSTNLPIPCVIFIPPNTLHGLHYSANVKGQILTLSDNVIDSLFTSHSAVMLSIENLHLISFSDKNSVSFSAILKLVKQIHEELFSECFEKRLMLESFFRQLIIYVCRLTNNEVGNSKTTNNELEHYIRFQKNLKNGNYERSIPTLASQLGITPTHLNRICRSISGKSTLTIVQEHTIQKAQNYLTHTSYSVSEITYLLNFEYQNHFARVFRKIVGVSPGEYRRGRR